MTTRLDPIDVLAGELGSGKTSSRELVEQCLARAEDPQGEGARTFIELYAEQARAAADAVDRLRRLGVAASPYAGIPISVKDLFDVAGSVTRAGSRLLANAQPATRDAVVVQRLRAVGFIVVGRSNMSEFAYTGLGINPHFGTPRNPSDRDKGRLPGGSSSGAAISVTDGMAAAGLGTDTGGSCRIPAALTGLVGFKPTASRIPVGGMLPLSTSLDSIGTLGASVRCCAILDGILAGESVENINQLDVRGLRLAIPTTLMFDGIDAAVGSAFTRVVTALADRGALITEIELPELLELRDINSKGGFAAAEAYAWHRKYLAERPGEYDPRIRSRIEKGAQQSAADYLDLLQARQHFNARVRRACLPFDALIAPTVPCVAPVIESLASEEEYGRVNLLLLRNPAVFNFLDGCAISLPIQGEGDLPVGLMVAGQRNEDRRILDIASAIESCLQR